MPSCFNASASPASSPARSASWRASASPERHVGRGEEHAPALRRCARWQVDEGRGDQGKRFVDPAATLVHDRGLALESGARDRGARPDRRRRGGVAVQRLVVAAQHARDIPERLLRVGTRGRILGAPFDGRAEVVDGLGVRVQLLRAMARAEQPRPRLRIVVASPVVERERIDELVHPLLEQRRIRVADGHVRTSAVRHELGAVRDLLHERVREGVRVLRRAGGLVHEPLRRQRAERGRDIQVRRDTGDDPLPEGPADDRAGVRDASGRRLQRVEPRLEEVLNGRGHARDRAILQRPHDLLGGPFEDERPRRWVDRGGRDAVDELLGGTRVERLERDRVRRPPRRRRIACRAQEQAALGWDDPGDLREDLGGGRVGPVQVFDDDHQRAFAAAIADHLAEQRDHEAALALRIELRHDRVPEDLQEKRRRAVGGHSSEATRQSRARGIFGVRR